MIKENIEKNQKEIGEAKLVVVTKNRSIDEINEAIKTGTKIIGENRVKEFAKKADKIKKVEKHMIGHLQTNKVKEAVKLFDCIQSIDSIKLVKEIDKRCKTIHKVMPIMLEIKFEDQKYGFLSEELEEALEDIKDLENVKVVGLMCMAPYVEPEQTRTYFKKMKQLQEIFNLEELSMGMTNDYKVAIEEGSTIVRIGTAIFE